ncbi:head GIN domain-containing protein [Qipengyuania sp. JC766]|uniref:head GIN domain-containing protein n=1 Tax=Qipengyuania sp. JC766 TaxID=3232139 RepID=UPI0034583587
MNAIARTLAAATLMMGVTGCNVSYSRSSSDGVPLSELDMSGQAPAGLELAAPVTVRIEEGPALSITPSGDDELVAALRYEIEDGQLKIDLEDGNWRFGGNASIVVTMPAPRSLEVDGSGDIESFALSGDAEVEIAGSGGIQVDAIDTRSLDIAIAGSGDLTGAGTTDTISIEIAGSGNVGLADLQAGSGDIAIAGSGDVAFASDGKISVRIAGSGDVRITGNATCDVSTAGSGDVICANSGS